MSNLVGVSEAIVVDPGATGRCGPGTLPPTTCVRFDNFNRTEASGWGSSDSPVFAWTQVIQSGSPASSVNGSQGVLSLPNRNDYILMRVDGSGPWSSPFLMVARVTVDLWGNIDLLFGADKVGTYDANVEIDNGGSINVVGIHSSGSGGSSFSLIDGATYLVKWDFHYTDTHVRVRMWNSADTEPSTWAVDFDDGSFSPAPDRFYVNAGSTNLFDAENCDVDYIDFAYGAKPLCPS